MHILLSLNSFKSGIKKNKYSSDVLWMEDMEEILHYLGWFFLAINHQLVPDFFHSQYGVVPPTQ